VQSEAQCQPPAQSGGESRLCCVNEDALALPTQQALVVGPLDAQFERKLPLRPRFVCSKSHYILKLRSA
jgi:hypothetical protein